METDLFLALLDKQNPRGHPILAALLYAFCPAAARWWLAGADPVDASSSKASKGSPFDPAWQALSDHAAGETLKDALTRHGFENLLEEARGYVAQVDAWRDRHPGVTAAETLPTFSGGRLPLSRRFGKHDAIRNFGGRWENFFAYIRTWAVLIPDWEAAMRFAAPAELRPVRLALSAQGVRRPVYLPAWSWVSRVGEVSHQVIGMLVRGRDRDQLRLGLARLAGPAGEKPWPSTPEVWVLERGSGRAEPADVRLEEGALPRVVERLADLAQKGPHAPLAALQGSSQCAGCGFRAQCFLPTGEISPLALAFG